ncbi:hypothetical protein DHD32_08815 [Arenibacter sp. TNZ]|nr:hypothetical protein [Arenibacter sp. TNZ]
MSARKDRCFQTLPSPPQLAEDPPCPPAENAGQAYPREGAFFLVIGQEFEKLKVHDTRKMEMS